MRRLVLALALAGGLAALGAGAALADGGPHGEMANPVDASGSTLQLQQIDANMTANTDHCAGCHRPHTAQADSRLLRMPSIYQLCTDCHNGSGSVLDVMDGVRLDTRAAIGSGQEQAVSGGNVSGVAGLSSALPLNGGGFSYFKGAPVTSKHNVGIGVAEAWGAGTAAPGQLGFFDPTGGETGGPATLDCTSCHNPHGSTNYRILNSNIGGRNLDVLAFAPPDNMTPVPQATPGLVANEFGRGLDTQYNASGTPVATPPANKYTVPYYASQNLEDGVNGAGAGGYFGAVSATSTALRNSLVTPGASSNTALVGVSLLCGACHTAYPSSDASSGDYDYSATDVDPAYQAAVATAVAAGSPTPAPAYRHRTEMGYDEGVNYKVKYDPVQAWSYQVQNTGGTYTVSSVPLRLASDAPWAWGNAGNGPGTSSGTPVPGNGVGDQKIVTCLTCHNAHGSSANMVGFADPATWINAGKKPPSPAQSGNYLLDVNGTPITQVNAQQTPVASGGTPVPTPGSSVLLVADNRAMCEACHQKSLPAPTPPVVGTVSGLLAGTPGTP